MVREVVRPRAIQRPWRAAERVVTKPARFCLWRGCGQLKRTLLIDAFLTRSSEDVQVAKIQRLVTEENEHEFCFPCTNASFFTLS